MTPDLYKEVNYRILVLDGAMGTMIQHHKPGESQYRGERFKDFPYSLSGNNDLLVLTQPDLIQSIHEAYLDAGADIIETDTFNANRISQSDYHLEDLVYEMNFAAAKLARKAVGLFTEYPNDKPRWVAGSVGPTNKTASLSPDVQNPAFRAVTFDQLYDAYREQVRGLLDGGVDLIMVETIFDTLNAKAALIAAFDEIDSRCHTFGKKHSKIPVIASVTLSDNSGRTLSGQTLEAFLNAVSHFDLFAVGLNCSLGAEELRPHLEELSEKAPFPVIAYPNAGLPDQFGQYTQSPDEMARHVKDFLENGYLNLVGGCCGTTPDHIRKFVELSDHAKPREVPRKKHELRLSGLEPLTIFNGSNFINIGERTNVSGSRKFARLIKEEHYEEALSVARQQVENGAQILDISMDEAMLDGEKAMTGFLNMVASDPEVARVPIMIDSSRFNVIHAGLKCIQGKPVVNSISLKEGEEQFLEHAAILRRFGAAAVIMAFDEEGQATTFERRIAIAKRAYDLLLRRIHFPPEDIIFDPNILTVATGIEDHNNYAVDYLRAVSWIKSNLPFTRTSGGISNLSFSFRGNDALREAIHSAFLFHAVKAGLDMGIVNAGALPVYDEIPSDLLRLIEDVILNRRKDATGRLVAFTDQIKETYKKEDPGKGWRSFQPAERLTHAMVHGIPEFIDSDIDESLTHFESALQVIEGPLMEGMNQVGELFGNGKMFLPQVVRSARVMKKAVARLAPLLESERASQKNHISRKGRVILATVKGDVHDIGKNIVGVVLACNNYEVIDLGVMVPAARILEAAIQHKADIIGLSGLITPSLEEMVHVAKEMDRNHLNIPLLIGGATTSEIHTAVKIDPCYPHAVVHVKDASRAAGIIANLLGKGNGGSFQEQLKARYNELRNAHEKKEDPGYISICEARKNRLKTDWKNRRICKPQWIGNKIFPDYPLEEISGYIDWTFFFHAWKLNGKYPAILTDPVKGREAKKLFADAKQMIGDIISKKMLFARGVIGLYPCNSTGDDIEVYQDTDRSRVIATFRFLRSQQHKEPGDPNLCLADFVAPKDSGVTDYMGFFAVTAGLGVEEWAEYYEQELDDYHAIMIKILADRLAEAFAELIHQRVRTEFWGYAKEENFDIPALIREEYVGIRPAPGYPACPEHSEKITLFDLLDVSNQAGIKLTENFAMYPGASVSGYYFSYPGSRYFNVGRIGKDQITDYARRKGIAIERAESLLNNNLNYRI